MLLPTSQLHVSQVVSRLVYNHRVSSRICCKNTSVSIQELKESSSPPLITVFSHFVRYPFFDNFRISLNRNRILISNRPLNCNCTWGEQQVALAVPLTFALSCPRPPSVAVTSTIPLKGGGVIEPILTPGLGTAP